MAGDRRSLQLLPTTASPSTVWDAFASAGGAGGAGAKPGLAGAGALCCAMLCCLRYTLLPALRSAACALSSKGALCPICVPTAHRPVCTLLAPPSEG